MLTHRYAHFTAPCLIPSSLPPTCAPERIAPVAMEPVISGGIGWQRARLPAVPADAHCLDLAFLDSPNAQVCMCVCGGGGGGRRGGVSPTSRMSSVCFRVLSQTSHLTAALPPCHRRRHRLH